jgi:hypothetical protein
MMASGPPEAGEQMTMIVSWPGEMVAVIGFFLHPEQMRIRVARSTLNDIRLVRIMAVGKTLYRDLPVL